MEEQVINTEKSYKFSDKRDFVAVKKVKAGDKGAFSHIYNKYYSFIYYRILGKTGDVGIAEDLTAITMVKAYEKLEGFAMINTFNAWITSIANNLVIDTYRNKSITKRNPDSGFVYIDEDFNSDNDEGDSTSFQINSGSLNGEEAMIRKERHKDVNNAIDGLDENSKNIIKLFYYDDKNLNEIVKETGLSLSAVKVRLFRAKGKIKDLLKK